MARSHLLSALCLPALVALALSSLAFSSAQTFPCPSTSSNSNAAGGYQNINLAAVSNQDAENIILAGNASFAEWVETGGNITACNDLNLIDSVSFEVVQACSQVVAGTNYGLRYIVNYNCVVNSSALAEDQLVINAVVYFPLQTNSNAVPVPQVQSVWQDQAYPIEEVELIAEPSAAPTTSAAAPTTSAASPTSSLRSFGNLDGL